MWPEFSASPSWANKTSVTLGKYPQISQTGDVMCHVISAQKAFFSPFKYILLHSSHSFIVEEIQLSKTSYWRLKEIYMKKFLRSSQAVKESLTWI